MRQGSAPGTATERLRALQSESDKVSARLIEEGDGLTLDALSEECADAGQAAQFCLGRSPGPKGPEPPLRVMGTRQPSLGWRRPN